MCGWTNYIIIDDLKLAVEISRHVLDLDDYEKDSIDYLTEEKDINDIGETKFNCLTLDDLSELTITHANVYNLNGFNTDKFLIYWLITKKIGYEIVSEHNVDIDELKKDGYNIIRLYNDNTDEKKELWND